ncbi:hypothetical protein ACQJBY_056776 [Aegilops geniculata]
MSSTNPPSATSHVALTRHPLEHGRGLSEWRSRCRGTDSRSLKKGLLQASASSSIPLCRLDLPDVDDGAGAAARPGGGRQPRRPRRHLQAPPQLQVQSDDGGQREEGAGGAEPGPRERAAHHHGLLHAGDDRLRPAQAGQGVGGAARHPGGDHVVGELPRQDPAVPRRGRGGVPHQARAPLRRLPPLQPGHRCHAHAVATAGRSVPCC